MLKMFARGEVDAYADNRARLVEAANEYAGLRVVEDNFTVLEQNLVVPKGDAARLKIIDDFPDEDCSSGFLRDTLVRAKLAGVEAPPPGIARRCQQGCSGEKPKIRAESGSVKNEYRPQCVLGSLRRVVPGGRCGSLNRVRTGIVKLAAHWIPPATPA
jgi:hypothetical protein